MADQDLIIYDGELELTGEFKFDVGHSSWSNPIELFSEAEPIETCSSEIVAKFIYENIIII